MEPTCILFSKVQHPMQEESFPGSAGPLELLPVPEIPNALGSERAYYLGTALSTVPGKSSSWRQSMSSLHSWSQLRCKWCRMKAWPKAGCMWCQSCVSSNIPICCRLPASDNIPSPSLWIITTFWWSAKKHYSRTNYLGICNLSNWFEVMSKNQKTNFSDF